MLRCVFTVEYGIARFLCAMRVSEVHASSSFPATFVPNFVFSVSIAVLESRRKIAFTQEEKSITQCSDSTNHAPRLFDATGTEAFSSEHRYCNKYSAVAQSSRFRLRSSCDVGNGLMKVENRRLHK